MAINKAMYNGVESIMSAFDRNAQTPYYSVWAGKDMMFSFNDDDIEAGRLHLMENLIACEQNEHSDILKIKFHPKKEKLFISDKTPAIATLFVRVTDPNYFKGNIQPYQQPVNNQLNLILERQMEMLSGINNRLSLLEESDIQDEEEDTDDVLGKVGAILNNPVINQLLGLITPFLQKSNVPVNNVAIAGLDDDQTIEFADQLDDQTVLEDNIKNVLTDQVVISLVTIKEAGIDIEAGLIGLAKMAKENPNKLKMLLTYL